MTRASPIILAVLLAVTELAGYAVAAEPRWLSERDLAYVFVGREVAGTYANGTSFSETYRKIGKAEYRDPQHSLAGTWSIQGEVFCTRYGHSDNKGGGCFRVSQPSDNCFEFWLLNEAGALADANWIARSWHSKNPSTCPP